MSKNKKKQDVNDHSVASAKSAALALIGPHALTINTFDETLEQKKKKLLEEYETAKKAALAPIEAATTPLKEELQKLETERNKLLTPFKETEKDLSQLNNTWPFQSVTKALQEVREKNFNLIKQEHAKTRLLFTVGVTFFGTSYISAPLLAGAYFTVAMILAATLSVDFLAQKFLFSEHDVTSKKHYTDAFEDLEWATKKAQNEDQKRLYEQFGATARAVYHLEHAAYLNTKGPLARFAGKRVLEKVLKNTGPETINPENAALLRAAYNRRAFPAPGSFAAVLESRINGFRNTANRESIRLLEEKVGDKKPLLPAPQ